MAQHDLSDRERKVLEAVIQSYVDRAEPAGSRTIAKKFPLGISAATIRNTMSDLEDRGYLYHPHASAGRVPTDRAYRVYVDGLIAPGPVSKQQQLQLDRKLLEGHTAIESILVRAADALGVVTRELGVASSPPLDSAVLERLELIIVSSEKLLMVLVLKGTAARTIFVEVPNELPSEAIETVAHVLNERLTGLKLDEIRRSVKHRLRGAGDGATETELLNIFVEEAEQLFNVSGDSDVVMGSAQMLAGQPEFHSNEKMRELLQLTEKKDVLSNALRARSKTGLSITIGTEHTNPQLSEFTIVTTTYRHGTLSGVIGVMGPTRMPYDKVVSLVEYTSKLVEKLGKRQ